MTGALPLLFAALGPVEPDAGEARVAALVAAARGGDRGAARELYRLHAGRVFRAVRALGRSDADAEDAAQETFVRAFAALDRYRPRPGARFVSWLLAIAVNVVRRRARAEARVELTPDARDLEPDPEGGDPLGEAVDRAREKAALLAALATLSPRDREIVSLRYGAELSAAEVAASTGVSEANVRKICERARARLEAELEARLARRTG